MRLRHFARAVAKGWNLVCGDAHRNVAGHRLAQADRHLGKAREHDWRADAYDAPEPTELDAGADRPFRPL